MSTKLQRSTYRTLGRAGGLTTSIRHNPSQYTEAARKAFNLRFYDEVDPKRELPEAERERRVEAARKLYFTRLSLRAAQARERKARLARQLREADQAIVDADVALVNALQTGLTSVKAPEMHGEMSYETAEMDCEMAHSSVAGSPSAQEVPRQ